MNSSKQVLEIGATVISIIYMGKLKHRVVKWLAHCHLSVFKPKEPGWEADSPKRKLNEENKREGKCCQQWQHHSHYFTQRQELQLQHPSCYLDVLACGVRSFTGDTLRTALKGTCPPEIKCVPHPGNSEPGLCSLLNAFDSFGSSGHQQYLPQLIPRSLVCLGALLCLKQTKVANQGEHLNLY